ncbi:MULTISPECIES: hypothetical protein [Mucilaginibacter]|uniref:Uncharacterized protein n=3 Tax=Mucilaginibacter TaxID=423349 RepID=A0A437MY62_9SPHI|nr:MULTISPECIES: hypothetical protein [Mucilaginibacter]MDT3401111.1 flagellar biosynthesis GTPase FlhF [Mucilaginibacter terrae]MVN91401.1 hypothetical protein [Mucilaginibacter aquatilis]RVU02536.1 hypothetical protein EOD41_00940 [Mucilaginibacter limnophilus]
MKTAEKNANGVQVAAAKANEANRTTNRPSLTGKEAKEHANTTNEQPAENSQTAEPAPAQAAPSGTATVDNQPINAANQPATEEVKAEAQAEPAKTEEVKFEPKKFALNLEQTLKSVNDLHRLSIQRLALIARIKTLEDFEVQLQEENDELESNPYQGCKLIIQDDKRREFVTNTPNLIRMVAQFIFDACHEKLADIEANIVFPNA